MKIIVLCALAVMVIGCTQGGPPSVTSQTVDAATATPAASVVCDFFVEGGPHDDVVAAATSGIIEGNPAQVTRQAIEGIQGIAGRANGDEQEDLLALADAMNDAAMS